MKLVRILLWIVGVIALVAVGLLVFAPKEKVVTRTGTINTPVEYAFEQVNTLKHWKSWMPWLALDPEMSISYDGPESGKGASYSWTSDNKQVGNGTLTILESNENESIKTEINFEGQGISPSAWAFKGNGETTEVSWSLTSDAGFNPIGRLFNMMIDGMVGPDFEKGLANLNEAAVASYEEAKKAEAAAMDMAEEMSEAEGQP